MTRPARVIIDLSALRHNFSRVRELAPNSRIISVVKADAYGHGLVRVARTLSDTDAFGVACLEEGMELRDSGINKPVILLEGPYSEEELVLAEKLNFEMVIHHPSQLEMLEHYTGKQAMRIWIKVDTGMNRLGFSPGEIKSVYERLMQDERYNKQLAFMTHLADASDAKSGKTMEQLRVFDKVCGDYSWPGSIANSAGILAWPGTHLDYVRPGIMLYGISPMDDRKSVDHDLKPVMTLRSSLISIKEVNKGESVGYGADWQCPETMPVGIVAVGYGDGYPRHAHSGTPVHVRDTKCQVIGNPSMDMIAVDLRNIKNPGIGDEVELWGRKTPVEDVARAAGTIPYELVSGVHRRLQVCVDE